MIPYYIQTLPYSLHKNNKATFDKNGVIMSRIPYNKYYSYHATAIASYAIQELPSEQAYANLNWLKDNHINGAIKHDFIIPAYNIQPPWIGSLAQALSISALCRAYAHDNDKDHINTAHKFMGGLEKNCIKRTFFNDTWFCEYPGICSILNGHIYTMFGVRDMSKYTTRPTIKKRAEKLWRDAETTVVNNLYKYNTGHWSRYDLVNNAPASLFYHNVHIQQLEALNQMSNHSYDTYIKNWKIGLLRPTLPHKFKAMYIHFRRHGLVESTKRIQKMIAWKYL